ncbi:MAG TPA: carbamoyltransferase N-terminal domain-containing protein, partial [Mucilaginibacter sp.]
MKILGIGGLLGHDANAALLIDGRIIFAAQEERYTRIKHEYVFPVQAINDCLEAGGIRAADIDVVVLAEKPFQVFLHNRLERNGNRLINYLGKTGISKKLTASFFEKEVKRLFPNAMVKYSWHHFSHAISSYFSSGFTAAAFLCVDGKGEASSASIGFIDDSKAILTEELPYANGIGMLYTLLTRFLGFPSFGSEYKVMGLAPYGAPVYAERIGQLYEDQGNGAVRLLKSATFHPASLDRLIPWVEKVIGVRQRQAGEELTTIHIDIAASLQAVFEKVVLDMAVYVRKRYNTDNLLFCGGCAQNCVAAGKLRDSRIFGRVYNSPVGG